MARNDDGHYEVDESFITGNEQVKCDAEFTSRIYDKVWTLSSWRNDMSSATFQFEDYVKGKVTDSTTGFGIEVSPRVTTSVDISQGEIK